MASELEVELDEWRDGQIAYIRDYRYVTADAELNDERRPPVCAYDTAQSRFHSRCPADDWRHP
jgi:hypothetical protein